MKQFSKVYENEPLIFILFVTNVIFIVFTILSLILISIITFNDKPPEASSNDLHIKEYKFIKDDKRKLCFVLVVFKSSTNDGQQLIQTPCDKVK